MHEERRPPDYYMATALIFFGAVILGFLLLITTIGGVNDCGNSCQGVLVDLFTNAFGNYYDAGLLVLSLILLTGGLILAIRAHQSLHKKPLQKT